MRALTRVVQRIRLPPVRIAESMRCRDIDAVRVADIDEWFGEEVTGRNSAADMTG